MKTKIILLMVLVLFLTSCVDNNSSGTTSSWRTGTEGIVMSFLPDNPPSEILSRGNVNVVLKYSNKGAFETQPMFYLRGYDPNILPFKNQDKSGEKIEGKSEFNSFGSQDYFAEWQTGINMGSFGNVDSFDQSLSITACYYYETVASPTICIDPGRYDYSSASQCDFDIRGLGSSQGGPIAITSVKQKSTDTELFLEIDFANKGKGNPYITSSKNCLNLRYDEIDVINLVEVRLGSQPFTECKPTKLRLVNGKATAVCNMPLRKTDLFYTSPLDIRVSYNYRESTSKKDITIVNIK